MGLEPSLLLHPLDILGGDEEPDLGFFPAMKLHGAVKRTVVPSTPVQVRYGLTDRGVRALKALQPLIGVGEHMDDEQP